MRRQYDPTAQLVRADLDRECRTRGAAVTDPEWRALCELRRITARVDAGLRTCARCLRKQREADRWADRLIAEDDERRRPSHPPLGLRVG